MKLNHWMQNLLRGRQIPQSPSPEQELLSSLLVMAWVVEARDPYTGGHLWRVAQFCELLAQKAGFAAGEVARIALGGFVHDLGKVGIPDAVLRKAGPLSDEEYAVIKTHPDIGYRLLHAHPLATLVEDAVRLHHEMPDGRGYPLGLKAGEIPHLASIVGICDAFDAMTSTRPYRAGMPQEQALQIIGKHLGTQFDAHFGALFIQLGESGALSPIIGHTDQGIPLRHCGMCGPTVVLRRAHRAGDHVFCGNCGADYLLQQHEPGSALALQATGGAGSAQDLSPQADIELIGRLVRQQFAQAL
ncbi:HD-GYP domain-containing protein [Pseudomonas gingeri]